MSAGAPFLTVCSQQGMPVFAAAAVTHAAIWFAALPCQEEDDHARYHSHTNELLIVTAQEQPISVQTTWCFTKKRGLQHVQVLLLQCWIAARHSLERSSSNHQRARLDNKQVKPS